MLDVVCYKHSAWSELAHGFFDLSNSLLWKKGFCASRIQGCSYVRDYLRRYEIGFFALIFSPNFFRVDRVNLVAESASREDRATRSQSSM